MSISENDDYLGSSSIDSSLRLKTLNELTYLYAGLHQLWWNYRLNRCSAILSHPFLNHYSAMDEYSLYEHILSITAPWFVENVELKKSENAVYVYVTADKKKIQKCPCCGNAASSYDSRRRKWRHLDTCQLQTFVIAKVPRVKCNECGVLTSDVPWSEKSSRFTLLFEFMVIRWLEEASIQSVSRQLGLSWNAVDRIMQKAVDRGLKRRQHKAIEHLCVDEISIKKGHDYVTIVSSQEGYVEAVYEGRNQDSLNSYYKTLTPKDKSHIKSISMDMSPAYRLATKNSIPKAHRVMCFDRYHVAAYINDAVDRVRKEERQTLKKEGSVANKSLP